MGRKLFVTHVNELTAKPPNQVTHVHRSDEDCVAFEFRHSHNALPTACNIRLLATDIAEYPDGNTYMLFTEDDHIDPIIVQTFEIISPLLIGLEVKDALTEICRALTDALTRGQATNPIDLDQEVDEQDSDFDDGLLDGEDSDNDNFGLNDISSVPITQKLAARNPDGKSTAPSTVARTKIKSDIRAARNAGFRVGIVGDLVTGGIITVSIRVTRLGLSEEAMEAWGLRRSHYVVLLIRFRQGYRDLVQVKSDSMLNDRTEIRVALCQHYKPSDHVAYDAFDQTEHTTSSRKDAHSLEPLFIGAPLNDLFRERFARIVNFRESCGFNWRSAEAFVYDVQGKAIGQDALDMDTYIMDDPTHRTLSPLVTADALDGTLLKDASLPLVAMQFLLRHFVRCTEFCLVCHCKVDDTFEALKPYVCSKPLCLYQYMALGFGPSIEWEVLTQPYVVDLLVSFCWVAAKDSRLKEFPLGIDLKVPILPHYNLQSSYQNRGGYHPHAGSASGKEHRELNIERTFQARIDLSKNEMFFDPSQKQSVAQFRAGDWFIVRDMDAEHDFHYRIEEMMFPVWRLNEPITSKVVNAQDSNNSHLLGTPAPESSMSTSIPKLPKSGTVAVNCFGYVYSFDDLTTQQQSHAIMTLLGTLPSVMDMKNYLSRAQTGKEPSLKAWRARLSDPALNLLRWIIASNRSCILQVDRLITGDTTTKSTLVHATESRIAGMDSWLQFRFAQGAPDKEQRFVDAVKAQSGSQQHPTLFAWHGSPLCNWHSIIRQGLRFDETLHGRAYGDGVYMSNMASTSMGYSYGRYGMSQAGSYWPQSTLKIQNALSLQEVVNKPSSFRTKQPHYVVQNIDWIQTRYLLVKAETEKLDNSTSTVKTGQEYVQDPQHLCLNESGRPVNIPLTAVSKSRRPALSTSITESGTKKLKLLTDQATAEHQEDEANSVVSDDADLAFLASDHGEDDDFMSVDSHHMFETAKARQLTPKSPSRKHSLDIGNTDFVPGSLDVSNIKFLDEPDDASPSASNSLRKALQTAVKVQSNTPLSKLGWYINPEHVGNLYQWICELHSFDSKLPLAKDMKQQKITSIVLEMRFTSSYPFSPPFVRVVKPRFLPFSQGGGGHVTEGGAICMEMLTNTGWSAVASMEMVLLQIRLAMSDTERPAKLASSYGRGGYGSRGDSYGVGEAVTAYERACRAHGWKIPEGFGKFAKDEYS